MVVYFSMSLRVIGLIGFIWIEIFIFMVDLGFDSSMVKVVISMFLVNLFILFVIIVRVGMFLIGWGWFFGNGYGLYLNGGVDLVNFVSVKVNSGVFFEMIFILDSIVLKCNDGMINLLYIDNVIGVIMVDYVLNIFVVGMI